MHSGSSENKTLIIDTKKKQKHTHLPHYLSYPCNVTNLAYIALITKVSQCLPSCRQVKPSFEEYLIPCTSDTSY